MANWDTALGYQLYLEGKSDGEIADACHVLPKTVQSCRLKHWRKNPDGGRPPGSSRRGRAATGPADVKASEQENGLAHDGRVGAPPLQNDTEEVSGMPNEINESRDTARMMEVIAKMTEGMGDIKAVCVGNIIQSLWNLNSVDDIRNARNILNWMEANYSFG